MNSSAQVSIELIAIAAIVILFGSTITALLSQSGNSTMAIATLKEETLNVLSNESFKYFIQRIDFYFENGKPKFDVQLKAESDEVSKAFCPNKIKEIESKIKKKFYENAQVRYFASGIQVVC